jgi:hypothetical protein
LICDDGSEAKEKAEQIVNGHDVELGPRSQGRDISEETKMTVYAVSSRIVS